MVGGLNEWINDDWIKKCVFTNLSFCLDLLNPLEVFLNNLQKTYNYLKVQNKLSKCISQRKLNINKEGLRKFDFIYQRVKAYILELFGLVLTYDVVMTNVHILHLSEINKIKKEELKQNLFF